MYCLLHVGCGQHPDGIAKRVLDEISGDLKAIAASTAAGALRRSRGIDSASNILQELNADTADNAR
jgi:hypothetical protein